MTNGNPRNKLVNNNNRLLLVKERMEEEYIEECENPNSPTDSSEDSIEVKVEAISVRSKRKLIEPRRLNETQGPLKKRICLRAEESAPFRPWSVSSASPPPIELITTTTEPSPPPPIRHAYFRPPSPIQRSDSPQPVDLAIKAEPQDIRIPIHPQPHDNDAESVLESSMATFPNLQQQQQQQRKEQRNYKNMTRERRIEANARERTRVHTISAAFDTLRRSVPAYSHSQKLSKLSVLRIACSYIMTLSNMLENSPDVSKSVEAVSLTIQREGKIRKKKDED